MSDNDKDQSVDDAAGGETPTPGFWTMFMSSSSSKEKPDPAVARELELKERTSHHPPGDAYYDAC